MPYRLLADLAVLIYLAFITADGALAVNSPAKPISRPVPISNNCLLRGATQGKAVGEVDQRGCGRLAIHSQRSLASYCFHNLLHDLRVKRLPAVEWQHKALLLPLVDPVAAFGSHQHEPSRSASRAVRRGSLGMSQFQRCGEDGLALGSQSLQLVGRKGFQVEFRGFAQIS
jgi:hypothetical protein